jgi:hydroxymethylbilane synthase
VTVGSRVRIGARNSPLARAQADLIAASLASYGVESEFVPISTQGDVDRRELTQIGGTGVFTGAVRDALLDGTADIGVHSLKDLPTAPVTELEIVAYPDREDTHEVVVGRWLDDPPAGRPLVIGTGAPRRAAQLQQLADEREVEVRIEPIRGNVDTRLRRVREGRYDATVLAAAGLRRLGRIEGRIDGRIEGRTAELTVSGLPARLLSYEELLPAPGQGALAVEAARKLDSDIRSVLTRLDSAATRAEVLAERRFLAVLEAGCTAPVGARAEITSGADIADGGPVRDAGADLTLVAVIGRTKGDGESQHPPHGDVPDQGPAGADDLVRRGGLIKISGRGQQGDPAELGERLARRVLSIIDPEELRKPAHN